jgi:uncharacterized protein (TIGR02996 family)
MNEDAAFLAAVVANPADDTNRLVYADWLDEHDDPRGAYLRAEVEWAKSRSAKDEASARMLTESLDKVWVARVSRVPLGVCCDHIQIEHDDETKAVTNNELDRLEKRFGLTLPPDYRAFLLNYNGGRPEPNRLRLPTGGGHSVTRFHGVYSEVEPRPPRRSPALDWEIDLVLCLLFLEWFRDPKRLRGSDRYTAAHWQTESLRELIFIGYSEPNGFNEIYCLGVRCAAFGKVFYVTSSPDRFDEYPGEDCSSVADSFAAFLALLPGRRKRKNLQKQKPTQD